MARVRKGDRVLIECATGGVGVLAIQMARHVGAEVTGLTTSPHKKGFIEKPRRDGVHARRVPRDDESLRGYDFILNSSGGAHINWQRARLGHHRPHGLHRHVVRREGRQAQLPAHRDAPRSARRASASSSCSTPTAASTRSTRSTCCAIRTGSTKLTKSMTTIEAMGLAPHVGKVFAGDRGRRRARVPRDQAGDRQGPARLAVATVRSA